MKLLVKCDGEWCAEVNGYSASITRVQFEQSSVRGKTAGVGYSVMPDGMKTGDGIIFMSLFEAFISVPFVEAMFSLPVDEEVGKVIGMEHPDEFEDTCEAIH